MRPTTEMAVDSEKQSLLPESRGPEQIPARCPRFFRRSGSWLVEEIPVVDEPATPSITKARSHARLVHILLTALLFSSLSTLWLLYSVPRPHGLRHHRRPSLADVQQCTINKLKEDTSFLDNAKPITAEEFLDRRDRLAEALVASGADAFVLEPGYAFQYYGNTSQVEWEPWEPEERPFLMLILPDVASDGRISAKTAFLSPHFEESRVRTLHIPSRDPELDIITWDEHWNPYDTLIESDVFGGKRSPLLMIDQEMRDFIVRGLSGAGFRTVGLSSDAEAVRQVKSPAEIEILRAVNTGTAQALRSMRPCLVAGMTEDDVKHVLDQALLSVGFGLFFNVVMFDEHAATPHGGDIGDMILTYKSLVLVDVGAHYLGYASDTSRTFLIDPPEGAEGLGDDLAEEKKRVWDIVFKAQTDAADKLRRGNTASQADLAARGVIESYGYGPAFTTRGGHGIGIKAHESPYLDKGSQAVLKAGMAFTVEPGIYLEGKFGLRHEDVWIVREDGEPELMTGRRARGLRDP